MSSPIITTDQQLIDALRYEGYNMGDEGEVLYDLFVKLLSNGRFALRDARASDVSSWREFDTFTELLDAIK